jgi:quercetin dioxygenase-like cupin family protein
MKKNLTAGFALALAFAVFAPPASAKEGKKAGTAVLTPASDMMWSDVPDFPGIKMAVVDGDPAKGASHFMLKLADGFAAPLHHHTSDHYVTVVSGTLVLTVDGKETMLPPGSFFLFKGKMKHLTRCAPGADCVLAMDARGKWDVVPEVASAAAKK